MPFSRKLKYSLLSPPTMIWSINGKKLTETDKKRLEKLGEEKEFSEVIRYMLEKNIKLEQECIIE